MFKTAFIAAAAVLSLGAASLTPAFAAEGNGSPFSYNVPGTTRYTRFSVATADVGQSQYPNVVGRPGSNLSRLANNQVLPATGNEAEVQTANSLPVGFEQGTVEYAQAQSINRWMVAHQGAEPGTYAAR